MSTIHLNLNIAGPDWAWAILCGAAVIYGIAALTNAVLSVRLTILKRRAVNAAMSQHAGTRNSF